MSRGPPLAGTRGRPYDPIMTGRPEKRRTAGAARAACALRLFVSLAPFVVASVGVTVVARDALTPRADELFGAPRVQPVPSRSRPVKPLFESWETIPS